MLKAISNGLLIGLVLSAIAMVIAIYIIYDWNVLVIFLQIISFLFLPLLIIPVIIFAVIMISYLFK